MSTKPIDLAAPTPQDIADNTLLAIYDHSGVTGSYDWNALIQLIKRGHIVVTAQITPSGWAYLKEKML